MSIQVGDTIVWSSGKSTKKGTCVPLGIAGCRVLELGEGPNGEPAASLRLPRPFQDDDGKPLECGALIAGLEKV